MRAFRIHERGALERLVDEEAPVSTPTIGDALIRVYGDRFTPTEIDWSSLWVILAHEVSGVVPALGDALYGLTDWPGAESGSAECAVAEGFTERQQRHAHEHDIFDEELADVGENRYTLGAPRSRGRRRSDEAERRGEHAERKEAAEG